MNSATTSACRKRRSKRSRRSTGGERRWTMFSFPCLASRFRLQMLARKKFGQHVPEAAWGDKVDAAIDPRPDDRFVEIGAGPGALTLRLAPRVAHVTAIELDRTL